MNKIADSPKLIKKTTYTYKNVNYYEYIFTDGTEQFQYSPTLGLNMYLTHKSIYESAKKYGFKISEELFHEL